MLAQHQTIIGSRSEFSGLAALTNPGYDPVNSPTHWAHDVIDVDSNSQQRRVPSGYRTNSFPKANKNILILQCLLNFSQNMPCGCENNQEA